jgi:hypothetical protein
MTKQVSLYELEVDKIPGAWVITMWLPDNVTLRLKVKHTCSQDPDECAAQVRRRPDQEFQTIHEFWTSTYELLYPEEFPEVWDELPDVWTGEFKVMMQIWGRLTGIVEFGATVATRYASEPQSSRDHFLEEEAIASRD